MPSAWAPGRLQRAPNIRKETLGPKGEKEYSLQMEYDKREVDDLARRVKGIVTQKALQR